MTKLQADDLIFKIKSSKEAAAKLKQQNYYLQRQVDSLQHYVNNYMDSLNSLTTLLQTLCDVNGGVVLYKRNNTDPTFYYIELGNFNIAMFGNRILKIIPYKYNQTNNVTIGMDKKTKKWIVEDESSIPAVFPIELQNKKLVW